jgi:dTDP-glucose 4,6-dehydratase
MIDLTNKKILITGGCGFIGSNFIQSVLSNYKNLTVVNIDKLGVGSRDLKAEAEDWWVAGNDNTYLQIEDDIKNIEKINFTNNIEFDCIFHFAAESHVDRSITGPTHFFENNVMGMVSLLEYVRIKQPQARLINISTDEVYGHLGEFDSPFNERTKFNPRSPYAASKASADLIASSYVTTYGLDIVTTHCCNNFGKHQADEKFIPTVIRHIVENKPIPVYGTGKNIREWIHVDDHNKSLLEIAENGRSGERYNIGSKIDRSNLGMIVDIGDLYVKKMPLIEFVEDRKGHDFRYAVDSLNYRRQFKLRDHMDALKETIEFYKQKYEAIV